MLLALDTSTRMMGVALYDGFQVLSEISWIGRGHHTVDLAPAVEMALTHREVKPAQLKALAVAMGPGSFTGLRIGIALAKGIAFSQHIPLIGIPTLDIIAAAQGVRDDMILAAVLRAGRKRLAVGWYQARDGVWQAEGEIENLTLDSLADRIRTPTLVCGELNQEVRRRLQRKYKNVVLTSPAFSIRRPAFLAELAWERWQVGDTDDPTTLSPIYLHHGEPIQG